MFKKILFAVFVAILSGYIALLAACDTRNYTGPDVPSGIYVDEEGHLYTVTK